jgi:hypothetical protein
VLPSGVQVLGDGCEVPQQTQVRLHGRSDTAGSSAGTEACRHLINNPGSSNGDRLALDRLTAPT